MKVVIDLTEDNIVIWSIGLIRIESQIESSKNAMIGYILYLEKKEESTILGYFVFFCLSETWLVGLVVVGGCECEVTFILSTSNL